MQQEEANVQKYTFQFQYGAIKTQRTYIIMNFHDKISIPLWCD